MNSLTSRIKSGNINLGKSFVIECDENLIAEQESNKIKNSIIQKAKEDAQQIITDAENKAAVIVENAVAQAQSESDNIRETSRKEGYQDGYDNGYKDGDEKITQELTDKIINVDNFSKSLFEIKKRIIKSAHRDIIELLSAIATKVCIKKFECDEEIFEKLVTSAIEILSEKETVNIIVNPKMAQKLWKISDTLKEKVHGLENIKIIEDSSVGVEGTIVESVKNRVDCTIQNQIKVLTDELYNELNFTSEEKLVEEIEND